MGNCLAPDNGNYYDSRHSSANGDAGQPTTYTGYSAHIRPPTPDFGISSCYEVLRLLGEGGTGQTWLCNEISSGKQFAIKFIKRPIVPYVLTMLQHEIQIQARLGAGHVSLIQSHEVVLSHKYLGIVMQYASGGTLTQYVSDRWSTTSKRNGLYLDEDEARFVFHQVLSAAEYLHENRVAHRDLKLDNIVLTHHIPPRLKLCDFGFAKDWDVSANMNTIIGTPVYMAPELIGSKRTGGGYDAAKAELWACGVLLFVMLLGMFPFDHVENPDPNSSQARVEVWMEQRRGNWDDNDRIRKAVQLLSPECRDLLGKIFVLEESKRITVAGMRAHPWMRHALSTRYQLAWDAVQAEQAQLQRQAKQFYVPESSAELEALLQRSSKAALPADPLVERYELCRPRPKLSTILSEGSDGSVSHHGATRTCSTPRLSELFAAAGGSPGGSGPGELPVVVNGRAGSTASVSSIYAVVDEQDGADYCRSPLSPVGTSVPAPSPAPPAATPAAAPSPASTPAPAPTPQPVKQPAYLRTSLYATDDTET